MYVLLLSIFMAVGINSVCVKRSPIQTKEVILVNVFAGHSLRHHFGVSAPLWETLLLHLCYVRCCALPCLLKWSFSNC